MSLPKDPRRWRGGAFALQSICEALQNDPRRFGCLIGHECLTELPVTRDAIKKRGGEVAVLSTGRDTAPPPPNANPMPLAEPPELRLEKRFQAQDRPSIVIALPNLVGVEPVR